MKEIKARKCIEELMPYGYVPGDGDVAQRYGIPLSEVKRFDRNTSPGVLACVKNELENVAQEGIGNEYPDSGYGELTGLIAKYSGVEAGQVVLGNGADETIDLLTRAYLAEGGTAVASTPTFSFYKVVTETNGGKMVEVPRDSADFSLDTGKLLEAAGQNGAGMMFVCNPNNPTGDFTPIEKIEELARGFGGLLAVDEAYIEFSGGESAARLCGEYGNVVVIRTLSKAFGLAGMRIGYLLCPKNVAEQLNKIRQPYNINSVSERLAIAALSNTQQMRENVDALSGERERLSSALREMGFEVFPSSTNFLLVKMADAEGVFGRLMRKGLVVRRLGGTLEGILRVTVRGKEDNDLLLLELAKEKTGGAGAPGAEAGGGAAPQKEVQA
jgi:histidinol-phosphate aminotransferase